mgnify:CR=1 FL=1|jgi:hypothetical protein|tara:strand:+ start:2490 stop:2753 length:264 start_codon:yes stop_codon:yes gene_type:complete
MYNQNQLEVMSLQDLRNLNTTIIAVIKAKRNLSSAVKKQQLIIGDVVTLTSPKYIGREFTIVKVNRTKAVITDGRGRYTCPIDLIKV